MDIDNTDYSITKVPIITVNYLLFKCDSPQQVAVADPGVCVCVCVCKKQPYEDGHRTQRLILFDFLKVLACTCPFCWPLVSMFWISGDISSGFQSQSGFCLICFFAEANVMYIPQASPLVLHMLTSWWPAVQPVTSSYASAEVGLGSDSNGPSPRQKTNALPLCLRPGLYLIFLGPRPEVSGSATGLASQYSGSERQVPSLSKFLKSLSTPM